MNYEQRNKERLVEMNQLFTLLRKKKKSLILSHEVYKIWLEELKQMQKNIITLKNMVKK